MGAALYKGQKDSTLSAIGFSCEFEDNGRGTGGWRHQERASLYDEQTASGGEEAGPGRRIVFKRNRQFSLFRLKLKLYTHLAVDGGRRTVVEVVAL